MSTIMIAAKSSLPAPLRLSLHIQRACASVALPGDSQLRRWARAALADIGGSHELTVRIVGAPESAALNAEYRHKQGPTNVLSFPFERPPGLRTRLLGDLVLCAEVIQREAQEQHKPSAAHWAHMIVHGILHLRGYDHLNDAQAQSMEALEIEILAQLGHPNPYQSYEDL